MRISALVMTVLVLAACQQTQAPEGAPKAQAPNNEAAKTDSPKADAPSPLAPLQIGAFERPGAITKVEDSTYPIFVVSVDFGGGEVRDFLFNNEEVEVSGVKDSGDAKALAGRRGLIAYAVSEDLDPVSIKHNGKEVLYWPAESVARPTPDLVVTGVLRGAGAMTESDLPSELSVRDAAGKVHVFEHYVTEKDLIAANNKAVEVGFRKSIGASITRVAIEAAPAPGKK